MRGRSFCRWSVKQECFRRGRAHQRNRPLVKRNMPMSSASVVGSYVPQYTKTLKSVSDSESTEKQAWYLYFYKEGHPQKLSHSSEKVSVDVSTIDEVPSTTK